ncbi:hypothetical protein E1301_Tti021996 [Triplophysa tibetana]|uniref:Uncharacterized protein n=1 Tax=Triplophysa tibetana TaxID=1572043 RepID=A0A5A9P0U6_9TELE|nr:hypothetical protein E1301_Tti021996 [Triplophysa tibetana]
MSSDILEQIISNLQSCGLQCKDDLKYVQQEDLSNMLPVIQVRKLLQMFKSETEMFSMFLISYSGFRSGAWSISMFLIIFSFKCNLWTISPNIPLRDSQAKPELYTNVWHFKDVA